MCTITYSEVEFVKCSTQARFPFFINFSREKRSNRDIFVQKLRIEDVLLTYFEQYVSFLCNNQLKYTERMIFALNP